jgi:two-component system cell cycle response regulator
MTSDLSERIRRCPNLPSLPAIAMQVLELTQKADVDIAEIARIISKDAALSGKILKTVNSSFYGRSQNISTISHALVILGLQSVKTLVLGFSLVTTLTSSKPQGFKHLAYWRRSIYSATAARNIAAKLKLVQQEEAFLAALLQDIGMLVLDRVMGKEYGEINDKAETHAELLVAERAALNADHAEVGAMMAEGWRLPPILSTPIAGHHNPQDVTDPLLRKLTELVSLSGACAEVFVEAPAADTIATVRKIFLEQYQIEEVECDKLLEKIGKDTREVASLFEINIGLNTSFDDILKKANEALMEITLQTQQQVTTLKEQNNELRSRVVTDALTGLANRGRFDEFLMQAVAEAIQSRGMVALVMADIDKFKSVNDRYGHQTGDIVLKTIGKILATAARETDLAARYGGEEIALILPGTTRQIAATIAETIRRAIQSKKIAGPGVQLTVTTSFGIAVIEPGGPLREPAHLLKAADMALYAAKTGGRNCVRVFSHKAVTVAAA